MKFKNPIKIENLILKDKRFQPVLIHDKTRIITGGFSSDLLSHVIDKAQQGDAWLTILTNYNMVAPASMTDVSCLIICDNIACENVTPTELLIEKAELMEINILKTALSAFECAVVLNEICNS